MRRVNNVQAAAVLVFIVIAGISSSVQAVVNAQLGQRTDPLTAAVISFAGGLLVVTVAAAFAGRLQIAEASRVPPLLLTGGAYGAVIVTGFAFAVPVLGVTSATLVYIVGSLGAAVAIDAFGLFGTSAIPVAPQRVLGVALAFAGFLLARR